MSDVPTIPPIPEAVEAAKEIGHDLARDSEISAGVAAQYSYDPLQATHIVDRACRAYAARQNAELRKALEQISGPTTTHIAQARKIATAALKRDEAL